MRFGTTNYFLGIVKLTGNFQTYYTDEKKAVLFFVKADWLQLVQKVESESH